MKIKNLDLLEQLYSNKLAVLRDQTSTFAQILKAYNSRVEDRPQISGQIGFFDEKRFKRHVIKAAFMTRIATLRDGTKTFEEAFEIWKGIPKDKFKELAAVKALSLANCQQALAIYRYAPCGYIGKQALLKASRLAKTQGELWQVALHSHTCGNRQLWKQAVKKIAKKLK